jgi:two-component system phosphate regulon response regulator PhoB
VHTGDPRPPTVLIVEDDPAALRFYADALRASGFLVEEASSGAEALRSAGAAGLSIIVADLGLPDFDGFEVCRQVKLRPETRQVPVIAITGRAMALRDIELAEEVGFNAVLIKPCPPEALVAAVGKALNGSRPAS